MSMNVPEWFKILIYTCRFVSKTITISTDDNDNDDDYNEGEEEEEEVKKTHKIWLQFKTFTSSARNVRSSKMQFGKCYLLTMAHFNENAATADDKNILS